MASRKKANRFWIICGKIIMWFFIITIGITILYRWINPPITPLMVMRKIQDGASIEKHWVPIEEISPYMMQASIASEDNRFLGHKGFDYSAIQKVINERKKGKDNRGGSTISQQTAKNVFLTPHRTWLRKGMEVYFTVLIEALWSKERIMEVYLNVIEMGNGIYGCEAAAHTYFHTSAARLTKRQAALIVACYPAPRKRNPAHPTSYLNNRASHIMWLMPKMGKTDFSPESITQARERYKKAEEKRIAKNDGKVLKF